MAANKKESVNNRIVDLRSDTKSFPTLAMRKAMFEAELGDDVQGEDPTVNKLERQTAELLGKEAAVIVPSGTMANLIAILVLSGGRGAKVVVGNLSHNFLIEQGGSVDIGGIQIIPIENNPNGTFCLKNFAKLIKESEPAISMAVIENSHNMCGGKVIPLHWLDEFARICRANDIKSYMDGARVFNASIYLNVPVARVVRDVDSVSFCLSKALCAPIGAVLAGSPKFIEDARRLRKSLGGGMRQAGIFAAAGLVALDEVVPRLIDDHHRTKKIAQAVHDLQSPWVHVDIDNVHTNICLFEMADSTHYSADRLINRLETVIEEEISNGIVDDDGQPIILRISKRNDDFARLIVYPGVTDDDINCTIKKITYCIKHISA